MKTKTKKKIKHLITKKKLLKKKSARRLLRGFFITVTAISTGGLAFAIATTKPTVHIEVKNQIKPAGVTLTASANGAPDQTGNASWYALGLPSPDSLTCASTKFPRGTYLSVKNLRNGRTVVCLVNDYGPEAWTMRAIDLSRGSFRVIEDLGRGTTPVEIRVVPPPPSGINLPITPALSQFMGYNLCHQAHTPNYCDSNRQLPIKL